MKSFAFNLIPQKAKEVVEKEEDRDRSAVYTAVLPLFAVVLWLLLVLFNGLVVSRVKQNWEQAVADKEARIQAEFQSTLVTHGELVKKTQALSVVILKDIKPEKVFELTEDIFPEPEDNVTITGYGRDQDGSFSVTISTGSFKKFAEITRRFSNYAGIRDVGVRSVRRAEDTEIAIGEIEGIINFFFVEETQDLTQPPIE